MRYKLIVFLCLVAILLFGTSLFTTRFIGHSANAQGVDSPTAVGNLAPLVKVSKSLGGDSASRELQMSVGLALRNQSQLSALLSELYNPASSRYHQYLTVSQFAQQFGPTVAQQQAVESYLTQHGFTVTQTFPNRVQVDFSGSEALAEKVFGVTINSYRAPDGRMFFANTTLPTLPASLAAYVTYVGGLDNASQYSHPPIPAKNSNTPAKKASSCPTGSSSEIIPSQFSKAYNYDGLHNAGLQGQGQTVGVFELDGYSASDVKTYTQCFGGSGVPISNVVLDGFNGQPGAGAIEVELDMETILSQAPKLSKLLVYEAPNTTQGYNDEFARIVSDRTPVTSVSWGQCEANAGQAEAQQENKYFLEAATQGQSILVAAGDSGSEECFSLQGGGFNFALNADDPAAQPYVTGVGGTNLTLKSDNSYGSEHVWNGGLLGGAGGGGLSQFWKQPSWQTGPGVQNSYSNGMRETPDVSLDADPTTGYPVYCTVGSNCSGLGGSGWIAVGGTSAAAPMWAAAIVLTNQEAVAHGKSVIGFLNPSIYKIAGSSHYTSDFHDITASGNNDELGINGGAYPVTTNYDMATGWGSFNAANLATDLVALAK